MRTLIDSKPSSIGNYDIAVATDTFGPDSVMIGMFEVQPGQSVDDVAHVFSQSRQGPERRHAEPLPFVNHSIGIIEALLSKADGKLVIAGLGAGLVHSGIQLHVPSLNITSIEYDTTVIEFAKKYWDFDGNVLAGDVKDVVPTFTEDSIDVLFLNAFSVGNDLTSQGLFNDIEWIDVCMSRLAPNGVLLVNSFGDGDALIKYYMDLRGLSGFIVRMGQNTLYSITKN